MRFFPYFAYSYPPPVLAWEPIEYYTVDDAIISNEYGTLTTEDTYLSDQLRKRILKFHARSGDTIEVRISVNTKTIEYVGPDFHIRSQHQSGTTWKITDVLTGEYYFAAEDPGYNPPEPTNPPDWYQDFQDFNDEAQQRAQSQPNAFIQMVPYDRIGGPYLQTTGPNCEIDPRCADWDKPLFVFGTTLFTIATCAASPSGIAIAGCVSGIAFTAGVWKDWYESCDCLPYEDAPPTHTPSPPPGGINEPVCPPGALNCENNPPPGGPSGWHIHCTEWLDFYQDDVYQWSTCIGYDIWEIP